MSFKTFKEAEAYWDKNGLDAVPRYIVCAANQHKSIPSLLVTGARHYDQVMQNQIEAMGMSHHDFHEQGFIDQFGIYISREDAMIIAIENGQSLRDIGYEGKSLFSENLY